MPFADPEKRKEYQRQYRLKNKEKIKLKNQKWRQNNKEYVYETHKDYYSKGEGLKINRISTWKNRGIIFHDYNLLYDIYIQTTHCDFCKRELTIDKQKTSTTKMVDHDHSITDYDNVRGILCHKCNVKDVYSNL